MFQICQKFFVWFLHHAAMACSAPSGVQATIRHCTPIAAQLPKQSHSAALDWSARRVCSASNTIACWQDVGSPRLLLPGFAMFDLKTRVQLPKTFLPADCVGRFPRSIVGGPRRPAEGHQSRAAVLVDRLRLARHGAALWRELRRREMFSLLSRSQNREDPAATGWQTRVCLAQHCEKRQSPGQ